MKKSAVFALLSFAFAGCSATVPTSTQNPECKFAAKLLADVQMKWNDTLEFSVPEPAQLVQFQAIADDVNTVDFGEVTFSINDAGGKQVLVAKSEGLFKDWFVDVAQKLQPGRHQITMKVSNDVERLYLIRVAAC